MKRNKNVLVIGTSDVIGGAAKVSQDVALGVKKYGYESRFLVGHRSSNSNKVEELDRNLLLTKALKWTGFDLRNILGHARAYLLSNDIDFGAGEDILNHKWFNEADIVHLHNLHGNFFKLATLEKIAKEKPTVWTLHDGWAITSHCAHCFDCKNYNNGKHFTSGIGRYQAVLWNNSEYLWSKKKEIYKNCNLNIVTPSLWLKKRLDGSILSGKRVHLINNGVRTSVFRPGSKSRARKLLGLPENKKIVLYIANGGRRNPFKGWEYFKYVADCFKDRKDIVFVTIFSGEEGWKDNILNVGYVADPQKMSIYYQASDLFLFTSLAENFPLVTLEAMSSGLPIVSFDVGGVSEQVTHKKNGYVAEYKNRTDLIKGVYFILELDKNRILKMNRENRKKAVKKYSIQIMSTSYAKLYGIVEGMVSTSLSV